MGAKADSIDEGRVETKVIRCALVGKERRVTQRNGPRKMNMTRVETLSDSRKIVVNSSVSCVEGKVGLAARTSG